MRTQARFVLLFPSLLILYGFGGITADIFNNWEHWSIGAGNWGHVLMMFAIGTSGTIELFHSLDMLVEPLWGVVGPLGILFFSVMLRVHSQPLLYWTYLQTVAAVLVVPYVLAVIMRNTLTVVSMDSSIPRKKVCDETSCDEDIREDRARNPDLNGSWSGLFPERSIGELNPCYTHPAIYESPYPGFIAFMAVFNGLWWWQMAIDIGLNRPDGILAPDGIFAGMEGNGGHEVYKIFVLLMQHTLFTSAIFVFISYFAQRYDQYQPQGIPDGNELTNDKEEDLCLSGIIFPLLECPTHGSLESSRNDDEDYIETY
jgi:hypothetical protein